MTRIAAHDALVGESPGHHAGDHPSLGPLADSMGIELMELTEERAVARMRVEGNTQPYGLLHGGAFVVLGETLGSLHAIALAGGSRAAVGVDVNATHTRSASHGHVTAVCTPIHRGRTLMVHEIVVRDEGGRRCSTVRITNLLVDQPAEQ